MTFYTKSTLEFDPQKYVKRLDDLYLSGAAEALYLSFLTACLVAFILYDANQHEVILYWIMSYTLLCCLSYLSFVCYQTYKPLTIESSSFWFFILSMATFISGLLWGALGIAANEYFSLNYNESVAFNLIFSLVVTFLTVIIAIFYKSSLELMLSFSIPATIPFALFLLGQPSTAVFTIGLLMVTYFLFLTVAYINFNKALFRGFDKKLESL